MSDILAEGSLQAVYNKVESEAFSAPVYDLVVEDSFSGFSKLEKEILSKKPPLLITTKFLATQLKMIQSSEDAGFRFSECQIVLKKKIVPISAPEPGSFEYFQITSSTDLQELLSFAPAAFVHDRVSRDPRLGPELAARRYQGYIEKSFRDPAERLFGLRDLATGRIVAFNSYRLLSSDCARLLLEAVAPDRQGEGIGIISGTYAEHHHYMRGTRMVVTAVSAINQRVLSRMCGFGNYTIDSFQIVLQKIYRDISARDD